MLIGLSGISSGPKACRATKSHLRLAGPEHKSKPHSTMLHISPLWVASILKMSCSGRGQQLALHLLPSRSHTPPRISQLPQRMWRMISEVVPRETPLYISNSVPGLHSGYVSVLFSSRRTSNRNACSETHTRFQAWCSTCNLGSKDVPSLSFPNTELDLYIRKSMSIRNTSLCPP